MFRKISTNVGSVSTRFRFDGVETRGDVEPLKSLLIQILFISVNGHLKLTSPWKREAGKGAFKLCFNFLIRLRRFQNLQPTH